MLGLILGFDPSPSSLQAEDCLAGADREIGYGIRPSKDL